MASAILRRVGEDLDVVVLEEFERHVVLVALLLVSIAFLALSLPKPVMLRLCFDCTTLFSGSKNLCNALVSCRTMHGQNEKEI